MAYNFIGLVNEICHKVNEVPVTESTFSTTTGFYGDAKNAVNRAVDFINLSQRYWRFNHSNAEIALIPGTSRYAFPTDSRVIDFGSFRIKEDETVGNKTQKLEFYDYDEYLRKFIDDEYTTSTAKYNLPDKVCKTNSEHFLIHPVPDKAYILIYEYFTHPAWMIGATDIPSVPEKYRSAVFYGAMGEIYDFRDDEQKADKYFAIRDEIIKNMRKEEINRHVYAWSNMIERNSN